MESLSLLLQEYKTIIGTLGGIARIGQFLSGSFICKKIYNKGSTDGISSNPFIGAIVIGTLMFQYSIILNDNTMFIVTLSIIILNALYLLFYLLYTQDKRGIMKSMSFAIGVIAVFVGYAQIESKDVLQHRYGLIVTVLILFLIGSPLLKTKAIIEKKDASVIPFPIVLCGSFASFLWILYGIILLNYFMMVQNFISMSLCVIQVTLCYMYPGQKAQEKKRL